MPPLAASLYRDVSLMKLQTELEQKVAENYQLERAREVQRRELENKHKKILELQHQVGVFPGPGLQRLLFDGSNPPCTLSGDVVRVVRVQSTEQMRGVSQNI